MKRLVCSRNINDNDRVLLEPVAATPATTVFAK